MAIRDDFPYYKHHPQSVYFDSAATTLKPQAVIDRVVDYYERLSSNIHRGDYTTSLETSVAFEASRQAVADFIHAPKETIVFTSGASESLNLVAEGYGAYNLQKGDVVLINEAEHASNTLPWYQLKERIGINIEFIQLDRDGRLNVENLKKAMHDKVKLVSVAHITNVLGYLNDMKAFAEVVHQYGALLCVDGAQAIGHIPVNVIDIDADFYAFSAHKMLGPSGVGVLYAKTEIFEQMRPHQTGGGNNVRFNACGDVVYKKAPAKFESGTPNIEGVLGTAAAIEYLQEFGMENVGSTIHPLHQQLIQAMLEMDHVTVYNPKSDTAIISFAVKGIFAQDVAAYLNKHNISVRSGEHCAKMLNGALMMEKSVRLSLYIYNTQEDVDHFIRILNDITLEKTIDLYL